MIHGAAYNSLSEALHGCGLRVPSARRGGSARLAWQLSGEGECAERRGTGSAQHEGSGREDGPGSCSV
jgi:hypothetical protein